MSNPPLKSLSVKDAYLIGHRGDFRPDSGHLAQIPFPFTFKI